MGPEPGQRRACATEGLEGNARPDRDGPRTEAPRHRDERGRDRDQAARQSPADSGAGAGDAVPGDGAERPAQYGSTSVRHVRGAAASANAHGIGRGISGAATALRNRGVLWTARPARSRAARWIRSVCDPAAGAIAIPGSTVPVTARAAAGLPAGPPSAADLPGSAATDVPAGGWRASAATAISAAADVPGARAVVSSARRPAADRGTGTPSPRSGAHGAGYSGPSECSPRGHPGGHDHSVRARTRNGVRVRGAHGEHRTGAGRAARP